MVCVSSGLRELKIASPNCAKACPWSASLPGLVKISTRENPGRSYSGENGFALMRISRIEDFGGRLPPVKPSMKICPPPGPGAGPASACSWRASSSGSSERAAICRSRITIAEPLASGSALTPRNWSSTLITCALRADHELHVEHVGRSIMSSVFCATAKPLAVKRS